MRWSRITDIVGDGQLQYFLALWPVCGLFAELIELPLVRSLRAVLLPEKPDAGGAGAEKGA